MHQRVLLNAKWRTHPRLTGVQRYASGLSRALRDSGLVFDIATPAPGPGWKTTLWEQHTLARTARGNDILLCPANTGPIRLHTDTKLMLTLHCLRFRTHPENYTRSFVRWYEYLIPRLVHRADAILTVSHTIAEEISEAFPEAIGKLHPVYPGVDEVFTPHQTHDARLGSDPYCVFVGNASPAKNLGTVLNAMTRTRTRMRLVLVGVSERQKRLICPDDLTDRVLAMGHINDPTHIASILAHATALLAPSLYESFDLPTVEAMACACPVLASDLPVHREICADAARFIDATDASAWAAAIDDLTAHPQDARLMSESGLTRARAFSWARTAEQVNQIMEQMTGITQA